MRCFGIIRAFYWKTARPSRSERICLERITKRRSCSCNNCGLRGSRTRTYSYEPSSRGWPPALKEENVQRRFELLQRTLFETEISKKVRCDNFGPLRHCGKLRAFRKSL